MWGCVGVCLGFLRFYTARVFVFSLNLIELNLIDAHLYIMHYFENYVCIWLIEQKDLVYFSHKFRKYCLQGECYTSMLHNFPSQNSKKKLIKGTNCLKKDM